MSMLSACASSLGTNAGSRGVVKHDEADRFCRVSGPSWAMIAQGIGVGVTLLARSTRIVAAMRSPTAPGSAVERRAGCR